MQSLLPNLLVGLGMVLYQLVLMEDLPPYVSYYFDMNGLPVNPNALSAGDYQIRITDVSLCEIIDTVTVPGLFQPSVYNNQTICNGDSIVVGAK